MGCIWASRKNNTGLVSFSGQLISSLTLANIRSPLMDVRAVIAVGNEALYYRDYNIISCITICCTLYEKLYTHSHHTNYNILQHYINNRNTIIMTNVKFNKKCSKL